MTTVNWTVEASASTSFSDATISANTWATTASASGDYSEFDLFNGYVDVGYLVGDYIGTEVWVAVDDVSTTWSAA